MKTTNKLISILLVLAMLLSMAPLSLTASAATEATELSSSTYITYSDGVTQYLKHDNYLYKVTFTNLKNTEQLSFVIQYDYLRIKPQDSGITNLLANDGSTNLKKSDFPNSEGGVLNCYSTNTKRVIDTNKPIVIITCMAVNEPVWSWGDSSATAAFTSTDGKATMTVTAAIESSEQTAATCLEKDKTTYTATATANGKAYTNEKTVDGEQGPHSFEYSGDDVIGSCTNGCGYECPHENQTGETCEICGSKTHFCSFEQNGFCPICDSYEPAKLNDGYYQIANAGQLFWFANYINTVDRTANAVLVDDIDLENRPWSPIGFTNEKSNNFRGHFDGQGHTITGLYVEGDRAGLGFFGEVRTGTVENFTIYGEVVVNKEYNYVGGVIGSACGLNSSDHGLERNGATIRNITSYVNLTAGAHGIGMVGGFIGYANHETLIENCSWYGNFDAGIYRVDSGAGGFIGRIYDSASVTIRNCAAYGTITTEYKSGTFESKDNIYIGGFLSYSPSGAKTVMENNLWAGRIINNTNLSAENAHLSAYGTLTSFKSVTNCYMEEGSAAYITTSNVNTDGITTVTATQLKGGEIAYLLQGEQTEEVWGQTIGTDDYPVLGGAKVYQVTNCKDEAVYSNTNENIGHSYENGTCTVCGTTVFSLINGAAFDSTDSYIYGFAPGITSLDDYTEILVDGYEWTYTPGQFGGFGTGTKAILKTGDETVAEYIVLIYGDLNGDGWYDADDAFLTNLIVAGLLTQENLPDYMWKAADCNHDVEINKTDVDLLMGAGVKLNDIDQNAALSELAAQSAYIEYMSIISQSAGLEVEDTAPETNETVEGADFGIFLAQIFLFIRKIFNFVFSFVIK